MSNLFQRILRKSKIEKKDTESDSKDFESIDSLDTRSTKSSYQYPKAISNNTIAQKGKSPKLKTTEPKVKEFARAPLTSGFSGSRI